jgi:two-component system phosphate regulon response regulator PhoB
VEAGVLIVDADRPARAVVGAYLNQSGCAVRFASDLREANLALQGKRPDVVLLDWMPDRSRLEFMRRLHRDSRTGNTAVIILSGQAGEHETIAALNAGADDYVAKPVSPAQVLARIKAVLRRRAPHLSGDPLQFGPLAIDPGAHLASAGGKQLLLSQREYQLLLFLIAHPGRVMTRSKLLDEVWGCDVVAHERYVDVYMSRLRCRLGPSGHAGLLQTVNGFGYCLREGRAAPADR